MKTLLILILVLSVATSYRDPTMTLPDSVEVRTGETAHIEVVLEHTQTTMWNLKVYVDTAQIDASMLTYLTISATPEAPFTFPKEIALETKAPVTIDVQVEADAPSMQVKIPVIAAGSKGPCMKGCEPFLIQKSTTLLITKQDPKLALLVTEPKFEVYAGTVITAEMQLKNYGAATAYVDNLQAVSDSPLVLQMQAVPPQVEPGGVERVELLILTKDVSPGTYLVSVSLVFSDRTKATFRDSKSLYVIVLEKSEPTATPPPSTGPSPQPTQAPDLTTENYSYFLAGMFSGACTFGVAVMFGMFLKKHRPTNN